MKLSLSREMIDGLPEPDSQGVIRVTAGIRVDGDGKVSLLELNDGPVADEPEEADDDEPMPENDLPDLDAAEEGFNAP
jgi:hypothetical protein